MGKALIILALVLLVSIGCANCSGGTWIPETKEPETEESNPPHDEIETNDTEAMVAFTEAALRIEIQRDEIAMHYAELDPFIANSLAGLYRRDINPLLNDLTLLDCPQCLERVKDSLVRVYDMEIEATETEYNPTGRPGGAYSGFYPRINMNNVDLAIESLSPTTSAYADTWIKAQQLRKQTYLVWREILAEYDLMLMTAEMQRLWEKILGYVPDYNNP